MNFELLSEEFYLSQEQLNFYQEYNFIKLKQVFNAEVLEFFNTRISQVMEGKSNKLLKLEERDTYGKAFIQEFNLWQQDSEIAKLVFSKRLAHIATQLMGCSGVRLYHDQALFKESGGGITPWHADQQYWPFSTNLAVTAWIPLVEIPLDMGPLEFSAGSHQITAGRNLEISDNSERVISGNLKINHFEHVVQPFDLGEVSFHSGWIFHRAGANKTEQIRKVMTVIYIDHEMIASEPQNKNQLNDLSTWCPGIKPGQVIDSVLNPKLFDQR